MEHNTEVVKWIIEVVILCGKQCLPFIGRRENINDSSHNSEFFGEYSNFLAKQTKHWRTCPVVRNATCVSPKIQNEIINITAHDVLQKDLIDEIKTAEFFTILADEVEIHHVE